MHKTVSKLKSISFAQFLFGRLRRMSYSVIAFSYDYRGVILQASGSLFHEISRHCQTGIASG